MSINKMSILGEVQNKPSKKTFENGGEKMTLTLTTYEKGYTTREGKEVPSHTEYHSIVVTIPRYIKMLELYVDRGQRIYVEGKVRSRHYGEENAKQTVREVIAEYVEVIDWRE